MANKKMVVWKYVLEEQRLIVHLPSSAEVLCVQTQFNKCVVYVMQNAYEGKTVPRTFARYDTGVAMPDVCRAYIGTCTLDRGGILVQHVFEEL